VFTRHPTSLTTIEFNSRDTPIGRVYDTPSGKSYPSITTILGYGDKQWLKEWRSSMGEEAADAEMNRAAERGTAVHSAIELFLQNKPIEPLNMVAEHRRVFNGVKAKLKSTVNNILVQEIPLWSDNLRTAGRVDCVAEYKGNLSIVDFKTSTNPKEHHQIRDYWLQTTAYALMFYQQYGILIEHIAIVMAVERGTSMVFHDTIHKHIEPLNQRIEKFYVENPNWNRS